MVEKIRFGGEWSFKKWVAVILFGAIIVVFALWGVNPARMGDAGAGVAAVVNDYAIPVAELRGKVEQAEQGARGRFDGMPEAERRKAMAQLRADAMNQLISAEVLYQAAVNRGIQAADGEVREAILQEPFFNENGRFLGERYRNYLQSMNLSADEFERQIRKQVVLRKLQNLFVASVAPASHELERNRALAGQKLNLRFSELARENLARAASINAAEVADFLAKRKPEVEANYNENRIEYSQPEKYRARDILIRVDDKRSDAEARTVAADLRQRLTPANFAQLAAKHSDDPGSKQKGGDLGEHARGTLMPEFEQAALALQPGQISQPVKLEGGYHLILLESLKPAVTTPLEKVQDEIARRLIAREKEPAILDALNEKLKSGNKKELDAFLVKAGVKWSESGEFDLASPVIPKLGTAKDVLPQVLENGRAPGLVKKPIPHQGKFLVVEVLSWKEVPDSAPGVLEGLERMMAFQRAMGPVSSWASAEEKAASVQRNQRFLMQ